MAKEKGPIGRFFEWAGNKVREDRKKVGGMHAPAMAAKGLEELRAAFSLGGNIEQPTNPGIIGTWTPGEVADQRAEDKNAVRLDEEGRTQEPVKEQVDVHGPRQTPKGPKRGPSISM